VAGLSARGVAVGAPAMAVRSGRCEQRDAVVGENDGSGQFLGGLWAVGVARGITVGFMSGRVATGAALSGRVRDVEADALDALVALEARCETGRAERYL
jgi:hypothetical protein